MEHNKQVEHAQRTRLDLGVQLLGWSEDHRVPADHAGVQLALRWTALPLLVSLPSDRNFMPGRLIAKVDNDLHARRDNSPWLTSVAP